MPRQIKISKYEGNTHYSVHVVDSYGQEHHVGFFANLKYSQEIIEEEANKIWSKEVKRKPDLLASAIAECIKIDKASGILKGNSDGLD